MSSECTCGIGDAEFHLRGCDLAMHLPFEGWQRGGMTHYEDCWQNHLTCALSHAVGMLAEISDPWPFTQNQIDTFVGYIEENK